MKYYFGNTTTTVTTLLLLGLIAFWTWVIMTEKTVAHWGLKTLFLLIYGLVICCFAAMRDGYDKTVQASIDQSCAPGLFSLYGVPTVIAYIGAIVIVLAAIGTLIARTQEAREVLFFIMSGGVALKVVTIELARLFAA